LSRSVGLRTEILITLSILLGAALLFGGLVMLRFTESSLLEERVQNLDMFTHLLANSISSKKTEELYMDESQILALSSNGINCRLWRIYDQNLTLIDDWGAAGNEKLVSIFPLAVKHQTRVTGQFYRVVDFPTMLNIFSHSDPKVNFLAPLMNNKRFYGVVELSYSLNDIRLKLLQSQSLILVYVLLYGLVLVGAGYFLLLRNIIRPTRNLLAATEAVGQGDLENRLPIIGPLELSQLAEAYNQMVEALKASRNETESQITILEKTNKQLEQTRGELVRREKMASVGQLAAGLAHELGNPLSALIGYLEILKTQVENIDDKDIVERSLTETTRIDFLVRELLDFSKPNNHEQLDDVDLSKELNASIQLLRNQGNLRTVIIKNDLQESVPLIRINKNKLQQVFVNLLLNAVYSCGGDATICLKTGYNKRHVWVAIEDTGSGIAASELNRIFDPFYTTKEPGKGTGLGLTMCQRIVEAAGGSINVKSEKGSGSTFTLSFDLLLPS
jgi:two-component system, NtrC family, sensor kinase